MLIRTILRLLWFRYTICGTYKDWAGREVLSLCCIFQAIWDKDVTRGFFFYLCIIFFVFFILLLIFLFLVIIKVL